MTWLLVIAVFSTSLDMGMRVRTVTVEECRALGVGSQDVARQEGLTTRFRCIYLDGRDAALVYRETLMELDAEFHEEKTGGAKTQL